MAKFFDWKIIVILIILAIFVFRECSRPLPVDPDAVIYKDSVKVLKADKAIVAAEIERVIETSNYKAKVSDSLLTLKEREITRLKIKASQARTPRVDTLLIENPELKVFVEAQDSVIQEQGVLIDTLKNQLQFERNVREQLVALHYDSEKIQSNLFEVCEIERIRLQDMNERLRKKSKGKGLWFGGGFVAGWLARSGVSQL